MIGHPDHQAKILPVSINQYQICNLTFDIDTKNILPDLQDLAASTKVLIATRSIVELDLELWSLYYRWQQTKIASWGLEMEKLQDEKIEIKRNSSYLHPKLEFFSYENWVTSLKKMFDSGISLHDIFETYKDA